MRLRTVGVLFLLLGGLALLPGVGATGASAQLTYGASRVDGEPGIAIHWVLCPEVAPRSVDLEGYWGGSQLPTAVPVFWQIRSDAPPGADIRVETYVVGWTPAGFHETVPLRRSLPADLISISSPPGDATSTDGMSFRPGELSRDAIYRGDYEFVSPEQFARDGDAYCRSFSGSPLPALGLAGLGLGGILLAGRHHPLLGLTAGLVLVGGLLAVVGPSRGLPDTLQTRQSASAFAPGTATPPRGRQVLADISSATTRASGGMYVVRFLAPSSYSFAVSCSGPSIQVGEAAGIDNGSTGGRQLIGCATGARVTGTIAERSERDELVEVVVDPNGRSDWQVLVLAGSGGVGPFDEP